MKRILLLLAILPLSYGCKRSKPDLSAPARVTSALPEAEMDGSALQIYQSTQTTPNPWRSAVYQKQKFHDMENGADRLLKEKSRKSLNRLATFYDDLGRIGPDVDPALQKTILDEWAKSSPQSHVPRLIRGEFEMAWAWAARGGGWAKDVSPAAGALFLQRMEMAGADLDQAAALNPLDPNAWGLLTKAAQSLGRPRKDMERYFQAAIALDPGNVLAYNSKMHYLMPQWFGSEPEMLATGEQARKHMDQNIALGNVWIQSYVYQAQFPQKGPVLLQSPEVWNAVQAWYRQAIAEDDNLALRENYAYVAVYAGQNDTAVEQFEHVGNRWMEGSRWADLKYYNIGRARAYMAKAQEFANLRNAAAAETWYRKAIELGHAPAMNALGWLYFNGEGLPKDPAQAVALFNRAAALKDVYAINDLGVAYQGGTGVPQDYAQAAKFYRQAAELGLDRAQDNIGTLYREGHGVAQNYAEAMKWYQLSAKQGYVQAIANVGWLYENGQGVSRDLEEAKKDYRLAAARGNSWAITRLSALNGPQ